MNLELSQEIILSHFKSPACKVPADSRSDWQCLKNPLCGDIIRLQWERDEKSPALQWVQATEGCAVATASASILCERLNGLDPSAAQDLIQTFLTHMNAPSDSNPSTAALPEEMQALLLYRAHPARKTCAMLAWSCAQNALAGAFRKT
jgi:NifU-like protein involved in Fe-S cluster formation